MHLCFPNKSFIFISSKKSWFKDFYLKILKSAFYKNSDKKNGSAKRTRTSNLSVNSRVLHHWAIAEHYLLFIKREPGYHLLSHTVSHAVPSAVIGLTILFGMGRGVTQKHIITRYKFCQNLRFCQQNFTPQLCWASVLYLLQIFDLA